MSEIPRLADDYFALEPRLIARAKEVFGTEMKGYFGVAETAELTLRNLPKPSLQFVFENDRIPSGSGSSADGGGVQLVRQVWTIWLAVENHRHGAEPNPLRSEAGPYLIRLINAFAGWPEKRDLNDFSQLKRVQPPRKPLYTPTAILIPVSFETRLTTHRNI